ncbi:hypothetical protein L7F22_001599 [Adiantum nelumboides]|nr:hypothetical protein [Adiantum nelumboides]
MPYTNDAENLDSARSLSPRMELYQAHKKDMSPVRPFRARPVDLDSRWSIDFHSSPSRRKDGNLSPYSSMDNLFGSVVGAAWPSGFKSTRDALKRPPATAIKLTYFSMKERLNHRDGKDVAMGRKSRIASTCAAKMLAPIVVRAVSQASVDRPSTKVSCPYQCPGKLSQPSDHNTFVLDLFADACEMALIMLGSEAFAAHAKAMLLYPLWIIIIIMACALTLGALAVVQTLGSMAIKLEAVLVALLQSDAFVDILKMASSSPEHLTKCLGVLTWEAGKRTSAQLPEGTCPRSSMAPGC